MGTFNFVVAKFVPDLIKNEPVNVGIIVNDSDSEKSYGKFIENFRTLATRYHNVNVNALKVLIDAYRGEYVVASTKYLEDLSNNSHFQLRFTEPTAIRSGRPSDALNVLFNKYVSIESKTKTREALTKIQLQGMISKVIQREDFQKEWIERRPKIEGRIGHFTFDYGFKNSKINDLIHTISFAVDAKAAYRDSKALAISVEDALSKNDKLDCTAIIHPPNDEKKIEEYYKPALGYLIDKNCIVKDEDGIEPTLLKIKEKLLTH